MLRKHELDRSSAADKSNLLRSSPKAGARVLLLNLKATSENPWRDTQAPYFPRGILTVIFTSPRKRGRGADAG